MHAGTANLHYELRLPLFMLCKYRVRFSDSALHRASIPVSAPDLDTPVRHSNETFQFRPYA